MATYKYTAISKDGVKVSGVVEGFMLSASAKGRSQKVHFAPSRLMTYIRIQCALWCNIIRMIRK